MLQYGVELDRLARLGDERRSRSETTRIVSARPLLALYRVDELVRAVAILLERGRDVELTVAGVRAVLSPTPAQLRARRLRD